MTNDPSRSLASPLQTQTELELLNLVLQESFAYPWNAGEPESESFFTTLEQEVLNVGWSTAELAEQGQIFAANLEKVWATVSPIETVLADSLAPSLATKVFQRFPAQVPQAVLDRIVSQASQLVHTNLTLADQLVRCVQDSLQTWAEEDLQVLARPFAYAMRGSDGEIESSLRALPDTPWDSLSDIEQARLSLAIARYAIAEASQSHPTEE